jgi:hypothetical protein
MTGRNTQTKSTLDQKLVKPVELLLIVVNRGAKAGAQTVVCGEANLSQPLSQQEKSTRQMSSKYYRLHRHRGKVSL